MNVRPFRGSIPRGARGTLRRVLLASVTCSGAAAVPSWACGKPPASFIGSDNVSDADAPDGAGMWSPYDAQGFGTADGGAIYDDFPNPVIDSPDGGGGAPSKAPALFGPPSQGARSGGPCIIEPEPSALYPQNWLRPRFRWSAASGQNLFELRLHVENQASDLVVYTTATTWTMPSAMWNTLTLHSSDVPMTLSIRAAIWSGASFGAEALGSTQDVGVAPAGAPGAIVYWTSAGSELKAFRAGDETVSTALTPSQIPTGNIGSDCIGCHSGTPDGEYSLFAGRQNQQSLALVDPDAGAVGSQPLFVSGAAKAAMSQGPLGLNAVSKAHWSSGDHVVLATNTSTKEIDWFDLEATDMNSATGTIARSGTQTGGAGAGAPAWSHDGKTIAYVATDHMLDGHLGYLIQSPIDPGATADIFTVPYNGRSGGSVAPVVGANDPNDLEFYPAFSPDDAYLAFDKCPNGLEMYNQAQAEVYVIPSDGGTATRLQANSPPSCSGVKSPGITNSWPKWAPAVTTTADGRSFYWVVFSSTRFDSAVPQLFLSGMMVDPKGRITTYGAVYMWNQPSAEGNHTPAWEYFNVATPPPQVIPQ